MKKKASLITLILSTTVIFTSCSINKNTKYVAKYDTGKVQTGIYVMYETQDVMPRVLKKAMQKNKELNDMAIEKVCSKNFNGAIIEDLVAEKAKTEVKIYVGTAKLFKELKLDYVDNIQKIQEQAKKKYRKEEARFKDLGVSLDSFLSYCENYERYKALSEYFYGENGIKKLPDEKLREYFNENYIKCSMRIFNYTDSNKEKTQENAQNFAKSASSLGFEEAWRLEEIEEEKEKEKEIEKKENKEQEKGKEGEEIGKEEKEGEEEQKQKETPEEARTRINNANTTVLKKSDLEQIINDQAEFKKIENAQVNEPIVIDINSNQCFIVFVEKEKDENTFESKKHVLLFESTEDELKNTLIAKARSANIVFNEEAIAKFKLSQLYKDRHHHGDE